jgi:hypothetical protein
MNTNKKIVHIIGGGTVSHVANHLGLSATAYGATARKIAELCQEQSDSMEVRLHLTRMADAGKGSLETPEDIFKLTETIVRDTQTKIVFFNPAIVDVEGEIPGIRKGGKYDGRFRETRRRIPVPYTMYMYLRPKMVDIIRNGAPELELPVRKDIFLVSFKTTCGATEQKQYLEGLNMLKRSSSNLVLANDVVTRVNMIITPEEASYHVTSDREEALKNLVEMAYLRSHLTFTRSTIVAGEPIPWTSPLIPESLRTVVDYCIEQGAYKRVRGVTAGHFAVKLDEQTFLTSRRKTDFNNLPNLGLVKVKTDGPDQVIAYGSKPSVGGQSQRIIFEKHPDTDCVVHFHCPIKPGSKVPTVSQREYECGSHECGDNTARGLMKFGNLEAVYLDQHGPNIVFNRNINPEEVIRFIGENFDLSQKTGGYQIA